MSMRSYPLSNPSNSDVVDEIRDAAEALGWTVFHAKSDRRLMFDRVGSKQMRLSLNDSEFLMGIEGSTYQFSWMTDNNLKLLATVRKILFDNGFS